MNSIYVLTDPRTGAVRYVGVTSRSLACRLGVHIRTAKRGEDSHRARWVRALLSIGVRPEIKIVELTEDRLREVHWIAHYRSVGCDLTNGTEGGDGGRCMSAEARAKISAAVRRRVVTEQARRNIRAAQMGHQVSQATRDKLRAANTGKRRGPIPEPTKAKMRAAKIGHEVSAETRKRISESLKSLPRRPAKRVCHRGHAFSPDNTRINVRGAQECRECERLNRLLRRAAA